MPLCTCQHWLCISEFTHFIELADSDSDWRKVWHVQSDIQQVACSTWASTPWWSLLVLQSIAGSLLCFCHHHLSWNISKLQPFLLHYLQYLLSSTDENLTTVKWNQVCLFHGRFRSTSTWASYQTDNLVLVSVSVHPCLLQFLHLCLRYESMCCYVVQRVPHMYSMREHTGWMSCKISFCVETLLLLKQISWNNNQCGNVLCLTVAVQTCMVCV